MANSIKTILIVLSLLIQQDLFAGNTGLIGRTEAHMEIDSLVSLIEEIEVNPYYQFSKDTIYSIVNQEKQKLQKDSVNRQELFLTLSRITGSFRQGHLGIMPDDAIFNDESVFNPLSGIIRIEPGTHKIFITTDTTIQNIPFKKDMEIVSINDIPSNSLIDRFISFVPAETDAFACSSLSYSLGFMMAADRKANQYRVEYTSNGHRNNKLLKGVKAKEVIRPIPYKPMSNEFSIINDSTMLFSFNQCPKGNRFKAFVDSMFATAKDSNIRHLIIDIRHNHGGASSAGDAVMMYLSETPFNSFQKHETKISKISNKSRKSKYTNDTIITTNADLIEPNREDIRFVGKTYLLTSHETFSSAAAFSWAFKEFTDGIIIGEETGGVNICVGDVIGVRLPYTGFKAMIPCRIFYEYGAKEGDEIHGTIPHIPTDADDALDHAIRKI